MKIPPGKIIASGPVIIENGKVLLIKELKANGKITDWFFPGGTVEESDESPEAACQRESKEEVGIDIRIIRQLKTITVNKPDGITIELVHFLAERRGEISPATNIPACDWHDIHNLPTDCAPNIYEVIDQYRTEYENIKEGKIR